VGYVHNEWLLIILFKTSITKYCIAFIHYVLYITEISTHIKWPCHSHIRLLTIYLHIPLSLHRSPFIQKPLHIYTITKGPIPYRSSLFCMRKRTNCLSFFCTRWSLAELSLRSDNFLLHSSKNWSPKSCPNNWHTFLILCICWVYTFFELA